MTACWPVKLGTVLLLALSFILFETGVTSALFAQAASGEPELKDDSGGDSGDDLNPGLKNDLDDEEDDALEYEGFLRQSFYVLRKPPLALSETVTPGFTEKRKALITSGSRARFGLKYHDEADRHRFEGAVDADFYLSNEIDSLYFHTLFVRLSPRNRLFYLDRRWDEKDYLVGASVHRLFYTFQTEKVRLEAGRLAKSWGEGRFLNPLDLITPIGPFLTDAEDVPGADLLSFTYFLNSQDLLQVVLIPHRRRNDPNLKELNSRDLNGLLRYKGTVKDLDLVFLIGHHYRSAVWGAEGSLSIWKANVRMAYLGRHERHARNYENYEKDKAPRQTYHQFILGAGYAFFGKFKTNFEVFLNTGYYRKEQSLKEILKKEQLVSSGLIQPEGDDPTFFRTAGRIMTKNEVLLQFSLGYEFSPLLSAELFIMADPQGNSAFVSPMLTVSVTDESSWITGLRYYSLPHEQGDSEFQGARPELYTYYRHHF